MSNPAARLGDYVPAPVKQDKVIAFLLAATRPHISREIVAATGIRKEGVSRILSRLHRQQRVRRWKLPLTTNGRRWEGRRVTVVRRLWVYEWVRS